LASRFDRLTAGERSRKLERLALANYCPLGTAFFRNAGT